jgi:hypothetical protein
MLSGLKYRLEQIFRFHNVAKCLIIWNFFSQFYDKSRFFHKMNRSRPLHNFDKKCPAGFSFFIVYTSTHLLTPKYLKFKFTVKPTITLFQTILHMSYNIYSEIHNQLCLLEKTTDKKSYRCIELFDCQTIQ